MRENLSILITLKNLTKLDNNILKNNQDKDSILERNNLLLKLGLKNLAKQSLPHHEAPVKFDFIDFSESNLSEDSAYINILNELKFFDSELSNENFNIMHFNNRAVRLADLGLYDLAIQDYQKGITYIRQLPSNMQDNLNVFYFGLSTILFRLGYYANALNLYETRPSAINIYKDFYLYKKWDGNINSKHTVLLLSEQGIGDEFQYLRYAIYLKHLGLDVIVNSHNITHEFTKFNLDKHGIKVVNLTGESIYITHYAPLMSIPFLIDENLENIPFKKQYLDAPPCNEIWLDDIKKDKFNVGVFWSSNSRDNDFLRNIKLNIFSALFNMKEVEFHCLQKEVSKHEFEFAQNFSNLNLYSNKIKNFSNTASLIKKMDLIISIDTAVAHLSGAMGKPTWILLPFKSDCRWLLDCNDSIWYESVRLFRQNLDYDWKNVIEKVYIELNNKF